jgi:8-oxo-dGTP diphosphatase
VARRSRPHASVDITADLVILTVRDGSPVAGRAQHQDPRLKVLLVERANEPFQGRLALPGGFLRPDDESLEMTARRELREETGLDEVVPHLEQVRTYSTIDRDPRGRVVTTAFLAVAPNLPTPTAGSDARSARWTAVDKALASPTRLAFDHHRILRDAVDHARAKLEYSPIATAFCGDEFTIAELRRVYELIWGVTLDPGNFSRKVTRIAGFIEPMGNKRHPEAGRPAELYRRGAATTLHPLLLRP